MKLISKVLYILVLSLSIGDLKAIECLEYEPTTVSLLGTLIRETHPGRPNYESITEGDKKVVIWVVKLKQAICVNGSSEIDVAEENQEEIQLVLEREQYTEYRNLLDKQVTVTGKLFHSHTGHHYKKLLLITNGIKINA